MNLKTNKPKKIELKYRFFANTKSTNGTSFLPLLNLKQKTEHSKFKCKSLDLDFEIKSSLFQSPINKPELKVYSNGLESAKYAFSSKVSAEPEIAKSIAFEKTYYQLYKNKEMIKVFDNSKKIKIKAIESKPKQDFTKKGAKITKNSVNYNASSINVNNNGKMIHKLKLKKMTYKSNDFTTTSRDINTKNLNYYILKTDL